MSIRRTAPHCNCPPRRDVVDFDWAVGEESARGHTKMSSNDHRNPPDKRKWLKRAAFVLLGLFLLVAIPVSVLKLIGRSALRAQLQRLRDAGEPLTFDDYLARLPELPEGVTAAKILADLGDELSTVKEQVGDQDRLPILGKADSPKWSEPWPVEVFENVKLFLDREEPLLARLDHLGDVPPGRLELDLVSNPMNAFLPNMKCYRIATKIEALAAVRDAAESDIDSAMLRCRAIFSIGASLRDTPTLISALSLIAVEAMGLDATERVLSYGVPRTESLRGLQDVLEQHDFHNTLLVGLTGERLFQIAMFEYMANGGWSTTPVLSTNPPALPTDSIWLLGGFRDLNLAMSLELLSDLIDASDSPRNTIVAAHAYESRVQGLHPVKYCFCTLFLPAYSRACELSGRHIAQVHCARAALAAERFRLDKDNWPTQLAELVPNYIKEIPIDPFDGQPVRYKRDTDRITIYSIGENASDDGGDLVRPGQCAGPPDVGFRLLNPEVRGFTTIDAASEDNDQVP